MTSRYTEPVRAVLLAAGQGKRMKSGMPKVLHQVLGKAILGRILAAIDMLEIEHVHVVVGHAAEQVKKYLEENPPKTRWTCHLQEPQLGTGHALMQVEEALSDFKGSLLVSVSDCPLLRSETLAALLSSHQKNQASFSLLTTMVEDAKSYGRILRDENGQVSGIVEHKDATESQRQIKEINPAIYCLAWPQLQAGLKSLSNENSQKEYYLTDLLAWSFKQGLKIADAAADWQEVSGINSRLELAECNRYMRDLVLRRLSLESGVTIIDPASTWIAPEVEIGMDSIVYPACQIFGQVQIGENCSIGPQTQIDGPVWIGDGSTVLQSRLTACRVGAGSRIGPFAHLRESAEIGRYCRIGNFVEVKKSRIDEHSNVSHLSYIGDASLGKQVNIGAGTITANYDRLSGKKSVTSIGDDSSTGSNSVLVAPVNIGKGAMVAAGSVISRDVPDGALAVGRARQENLEGWVEKRKLKLSAAVK